MEGEESEKLCVWQLPEEPKQEAVAFLLGQDTDYRRCRSHGLWSREPKHLVLRLSGGLVRGEGDDDPVAFDLPVVRSIANDIHGHWGVVSDAVTPALADELIGNESHGPTLGWRLP